jgi:hypothetical protein
MRAIFYTFCKDERGAAIISDWIFLTSILVIAILPAMLVVRERTRQSLTFNTPHAQSVRAESSSTMAVARSNFAKCD